MNQLKRRYLKIGNVFSTKKNLYKIGDIYINKSSTGEIINIRSFLRHNNIFISKIIRGKTIRVNKYTGFTISLIKFI